VSIRIAPQVLGRSGRFSLQGELGRGQFAAVYRAFDRELDRTVALKLLERRALKRIGLSHIKREFALASTLRHPNLARHHELLSDDGDWFLTMELVEGRDFVDHVRQDLLDETSRGGRKYCTAYGQPVRLRGGSEFRACTPQGVKRLRDALHQLVSGVSALHDAGLVHCDLQPANVRVTYEGRVVILDYGLATTPADGAGAAQGEPVGTLVYMAPEQWERTATGPASDWYAVGVMLFEALTGGPPFAGRGEDLFLRKRTVNAPRPSQVVDAVPRDLDDLVAKLLQIEPSQRPQGSDLARLLA
jgi:serine/threonine protein kinase